MEGEKDLVNCNKIVRILYEIFYVTFFTSCFSVSNKNGNFKLVVFNHVF